MGADAPAPEVVIKRDGWGFLLPEGHTVELGEEDDEGRRPISLGVPGVRGETCYLVSATEDDGEIVYEVTPGAASHSIGRQPLGYAWPTVEEEHARLRARWIEAGGEETRFGAWAEGTDYDRQFTSWRSQIRQMRASGP